MITRYSDSHIDDVFSEENKFYLWQKIELIYLNFLLQNLEEDSTDSTDINDLKAHYLQHRASDINAIKYYETWETKHELVAFLKDMDTRLNHEAARKYLHHGLTSSDIIDTASVLQFKQAGAHLVSQVGELYKAISLCLFKLEGVSTVGRTHGRHAEVIDFKDRVYNFLQEVLYCVNQFKLSLEDLPGMISGPVGNNSQLDKDAAEKTLKVLGLKPSTYVSQALPRYLFAKPIWALSLLMSCYERFATLIRLSCINEVDELQEPFTNEQCGSSSMPHKKNPIVSENICGLARLSRSHVQVTLENIPLWWERDISHSSTERVIWPDAFHLISTATKKLTVLLADIKVNRDNIQSNLVASSVSSHKELTELSKGKPRVEAYNAVKNKYI